MRESRAPSERGSKLVRKTVLTDSRFPGTTELLSPASVELKGVRANLEEQVRKIHFDIIKKFRIKTIFRKARSVYISLMAVLDHSDMRHAQ